LTAWYWPERVALAAPLLPALVTGMDRRLLLGVMELTTFATVASTVAPNLAAPVSSWLLAGVAIRGFRAVADGLTVRLVTKHLR
jgi:predicted MFS family arabinose efflux permease